MIHRSNMDRLAGALMLNRSFREAFAFNKFGAIEQYNQLQKQSLKRPLDLDAEEVKLVLSFPSSTSLFGFLQALEEYIIKEGLALI